MQENGTCHGSMAEGGPQWLPCIIDVLVPAPFTDVRNFLLDGDGLTPVETRL